METAAANILGWLRPRRWSSQAVAALSRIFDRPERHPFDRVHGVDTGGLLYAGRLATGHAHDGHNAGYYATAPSLFHGAMDLWRRTLPATGCSVSDYTLVDIGCGKGRVLMLASQYEFREIIGVELNFRLVRCARKNLHKWITRVGQSARVLIMEGDALEMPLPDGPVALFYFNSFERELTGKWLSYLAGLAAHRNGPLDLIYIHPEFDAQVRQVPGMQPLAHADIPFSEEDAAADVFGVHEDLCSIYRLG